MEDIIDVVTQLLNAAISIKQYMDNDRIIKKFENGPEKKVEKPESETPKWEDLAKNNKLKWSKKKKKDKFKKCS